MLILAMKHTAVCITQQTVKPEGNKKMSRSNNHLTRENTKGTTKK